MPGDSLQSDALVQQRPDFRSAVMLLDNNLHDDDVDSMKFLCQGLVVGSKLKRLDSPHQLVELLEKANQVSETDFFLLADLLQYIQRIDVLESIGYEEREVMYERRNQGSKIQPFFVLLFQIAEELPDEDVRKASYMYGKVPRSHKVSSGLDLFTVMVQHQAVQPGDVELLVQIFESIERRDLVELIHRYQASQGRSVMEDLEQSFVRAMSLRGLSGANMFGPPPAQIPPVQPPHNFQPPSQVSKGSEFGIGQGPSMHDVDVSSRGHPPPLSLPSSAGYSTMAQHPSSSPLDPSAPPPSLPSQGGGEPSLSMREISVGPQVSTPMASVSPPVNAAIEGYDNYVIPWEVLDIMSRTVPEEYWEELSTQLGVPVTSEWSQSRRTAQHNLAVLKRWLDLPETGRQEALRVQIHLVHALARAGAELMAQEIATKMNIDYNVVKRESMASRASVYDENDVASTGSAVPMPLEMASEDIPARSFVAQVSGGGDASVAPVTRQMQNLIIGNSPFQYYRMTHAPRGLCIIINNRDFYRDPLKPESKQMISREGTDVDRDKLHSTFQELNFLVAEPYNNLTDEAMVRLMQQMAMQDHSDYDCFVCCILTHGVLGALYGVNGITVATRDMTAPFRAQACPSLAGKPKLFFMQACQGREKQEGHQTDMQTDSSVEADSPPELIPNEADFLLGYATVPGFVSYRSKTRGSWYITKLTEMLGKHGNDHDILDILTLVNYEVGKGDALIEGGQYKQSPAPMYSLRKKLIFSRVY